MDVDKLWIRQNRARQTKASAALPSTIPVDGLPQQFSVFVPQTKLPGLPVLTGIAGDGGSTRALNFLTQYIMANPIPACTFPKFFTKAQWRQALDNSQHDNLMAFRPVVKLFTPDAAATWLICSVDPNDPNQAFGLCDLGAGFPELGYVNLSELSQHRGSLGLPVERDRHCELSQPLEHYVKIANIHWHIVT